MLQKKHTRQVVPADSPDSPHNPFELLTNPFKLSTNPLELTRGVCVALNPPHVGGGQQQGLILRIAKRLDISVPVCQVIHTP
jgi:hypothetical protein